MLLLFICTLLLQQTSCQFPTPVRPGGACLLRLGLLVGLLVVAPAVYVAANVGPLVVQLVPRHRVTCNQFTTQKKHEQDIQYEFEKLVHSQVLQSSSNEWHALLFIEAMNHAQIARNGIAWLCLCVARLQLTLICDRALYLLNWYKCVYIPCDRSHPCICRASHAEGLVKVHVHAQCTCERTCHRWYMITACFAIHQCME